MLKSKRLTAVFLCMLLMFQINLTALADNAPGMGYDDYNDIDIIITDDDDPEPGPIVVTKEPTPQAVLDLSAMTLSRMPANAKYSVDNGLRWFTSPGGTESLDPVSNQLTPGGTILVYQPGSPGRTTDSDQQKIVMSKSSRPGGFQVTNITSPGGTGAISGISSDMEFSYDLGTSWVRISGSTVNNLDLGDYYIRVASHDTYFASDPAVVTVSLDIPNPHEKEPTPTSSFDARTFTLYDVPYHGSYSVNNSGWSNASISVEIRNARPGDNILVKALGDGVNTEDSDIQTVSLGQQSPPSGVTPIPATSSTGLGGLDHVNSNMEYCVHNTNNWHSISSSPVTGLTPDTYDVRTIASGSKFASNSIQVTVPIATKKIKEPTPHGSFDAPSMAMYGVSVGMAYSYDGGHSFTTITDNHCTKVSLSNDNAASAIAHGGIQLKMLGNGITTIDSDIQTIAISKASPPKGLTTKSTTNDAGAIYHVNNSMEYARENGNWNGISGDTVKNLRYGKYYVRFKAVGSTLASDYVTVEVSHKNTKTKEAVPTADFNAMIMTLSNIRGVRYSLDGGNHWNYYTDRDKVVLSESSLQVSKGIRLYRPGTDGSTDSDMQVIKLTKADPPTSLSVTNATASSLGIIRGVNDCMEYATMNGTTWNEIYGNALTDLQPATYLIRVHGKYNVLPSDPVGVVVALDNGTANKSNGSVKPNNSGKSSNAPSGVTDNPSGENSKPTGKPSSGSSTSETDEPIGNDFDTISDEPVLISDSSVKGWDAIIEHIIPEKPVLISMPQDEPIPAALLMAAKEADSDIIIGMDHHVQWSITASSIGDVTDDIDLGITDSAVSIPDDLVSSVSEAGTVTREFDIAYDGYFGFSAYLTLPVKSGTTHEYANLIYYNPDTESLELVSSCDIDDSGYASFEMRHASSYLVVVSTAPITSLDTKKQDGGSITTETTEPAVNTAAASNKSTVILIICVVVTSTIVLINIVLFIIKRVRSRKRHHK